MTSSGPRSGGHGSTRLPPEYRARLRRFLAAEGITKATARLETAETTLRRLIEDYALIPASTVERVRKLIDERIP